MTPRCRLRQTKWVPGQVLSRGVGRMPDADRDSQDQVGRMRRLGIRARPVNYKIQKGRTFSFFQFRVQGPKRESKFWLCSVFKILCANPPDNFSVHGSETSPEYPAQAHCFKVSKFYENKLYWAIEQQSNHVNCSLKPGCLKGILSPSSWTVRVSMYVVVRHIQV